LCEDVGIDKNVISTASRYSVENRIHRCIWTV